MKGIPADTSSFVRRRTESLKAPVRLPQVMARTSRPLSVEREIRQQTVRASGLSSENTEKKEKPDMANTERRGNGEAGSRSGS